MLCGPKCLKEIYPEKTIEELASYCETGEGGSTIYKMTDTINLLGDASRLYFNATLDQVKRDLDKGRPIIVLFQSHYCIVKEINNTDIRLFDPTFGCEINKSKESFNKIWKNHNSEAIRVYIAIT